MPEPQPKISRIRCKNCDKRMHVMTHVGGALTDNSRNHLQKTGWAETPEGWSCCETPETEEGEVLGP